MQRTTELALFVAGLPQDFNLQELHSYFSRFGRVAAMERHTTTTQTNYLKLIASDLQTYQAILHPFQLHEYRGRSLIVKPFIRGRELAAQNFHMNTCRVIAKNVPSWMMISSFESWLRKVGGPVLKIFCFKSFGENPTSPIKKRQNLSYSILFKDRFSAEKLIHLKAWTFPCEPRPTSFEEFCFVKKEGEKPSVFSFQQEDRNRKNRVIQEANIPRDIANSKFASIQNNKQLEGSGSCGTFHWVKPTAAHYHNLRQKDNTFRDQSIQNLQFKLLKP